MIRFLFKVFVYCSFGSFLCNIEPVEEYTWYSGIWHGLFFVVNLVRSWFTDALYKAEYYTTAYNVFYWIFSIISVIVFIIDGISSGSSQKED